MEENKVKVEEPKEAPKRVPKKVELSPGFIEAKRRDLAIEVAKKSGGLR